MPKFAEDILKATECLYEHEGFLLMRAAEEPVEEWRELNYSEKAIWEMNFGTRMTLFHVLAGVLEALGINARAGTWRHEWTNPTYIASLQGQIKERIRIKQACREAARLAVAVTMSNIE